jgi:hypothetical protein
VTHSCSSDVGITIIFENRLGSQSEVLLTGEVRGDEREAGRWRRHQRREQRAMKVEGLGRGQSVLLSSLGEVEAMVLEERVWRRVWER